MSNIIATTERLIIREIEERDKDNALRLLKESSMQWHTSMSEEFISAYNEACWKEISSPKTFNGMIFLRESVEFIGKICMQSVDKPLPELGIDIIKVHQNHGYAPEAIVAFCNWYFEKCCLKEVKVRIMKENTHSIHIFEKLGAEYVKPSSLVSENCLDKVKQMLPDADLTDLRQDSVREYILRLPIKK